MTEIQTEIQTETQTEIQTETQIAARLIDRMISDGVLKFGEFTLKSGRVSPYFFNLGELSSGSSLTLLGEAYAQTIVELKVPVDVIFGPAYKGIPIAVATACALASRGIDVGVAYNRKEAKTHGEGGQFVGAPVQGNVLIVDDVLTAGTAVREAIALIGQTDATVVGLVVAMDRQERLQNGSVQTALRTLEQELMISVTSIVNLQEVIDYLGHNGKPRVDGRSILDGMRAYQHQYCVL
ncbi:MAG: orotate phosphoribosyltransferase [Proteobacteria bacterium]|nr:orotate phosphoribosyltransferase [Pseudomonadota bacterium]